MPGEQCPSTENAYFSVSFSGGAPLEAKQRAPRKWKIGDPFTAADLADVEKTRHMVQADPGWRSAFLSTDALIKYLVQEDAQLESLKLIFSYASTSRLRDQILSAIMQEGPRSVHLRAMETWLEIDERSERLASTTLSRLRRFCTHDADPDTLSDTLRACVRLLAPKCDNYDLKHVVKVIKTDMEEAVRFGEKAPTSSLLLPMLQQFLPESDGIDTTTMAFADQ